MKGFDKLALTLAGSIMLLILGIIYFGAILWAINSLSGNLFEQPLDVNWGVLSASILATGAILSGALMGRISESN